MHYFINTTNFAVYREKLLEHGVEEIPEEPGKYTINTAEGKTAAISIKDQLSLHSIKTRTYTYFVE